MSTQIHIKQFIATNKLAACSDTKASSGLQEEVYIHTDTSHYFKNSHLGCDETGSTDFFGPLCVVACYIDERDFDWLINLGICDPKHLSSQEVIQLAREIKDRIIYSLLMLDNSHYNQMIEEGNNLANIKAKLYNQAVTNVMQKLQLPITHKVINQFVSPKTYYNYLKEEVIVVKDLTFTNKGEEQYVAMMCANILSKYAYLQYFANMSKSLKVRLPRGTSTSVDTTAIEIANTYGVAMLYKVTKKNMTNYKRVLDSLKKS